MPEMSLADSIVTSFNAQEPWPDNVKLFQPYEVEQILLPDNASCLAVQAFLKMCNLPFEVEMRWNAEFMSPSGRVPFIKCGAFVVSELESIAQFAATKGVTLCSKLSSEERAEMRAYMSLITNVLVNAELYISWVEQETFSAVTAVRNASVYPWPLGWIQTRAKRAAVIKRLKALHWYDKTLDQVLADVEQCCNSLSQRLGDKEFFFGSHMMAVTRLFLPRATSPCELDALAYGHARALLAADGPRAAPLPRLPHALLRHVLNVTRLTGLKLTPQEENSIVQAMDTKSEGTTENMTPKPTTSHRVHGYRPSVSNEISVMWKRENMSCGNKQVDEKLRFPVNTTHEIIDEADISTGRLKKLKYENMNLDILNKLKNIYEKPKSDLDLLGEIPIIKDLL